MTSSPDTSARAFSAMVSKRLLIFSAPWNSPRPALASKLTSVRPGSEFVVQVARDARALGFGGVLKFRPLTIANFRLPISGCVLEPCRHNSLFQTKTAQSSSGKNSAEDKQAFQSPPRRSRQDTNARRRVQQKFKSAYGPIAGAISLRRIGAGQFQPAAGGRQFEGLAAAVDPRLEREESGLEFQHVFGALAPLIHQRGLHLDERAGVAGQQQLIRRELCRRGTKGRGRFCAGPPPSARPADRPVRESPRRPPIRRRQRNRNSGSSRACHWCRRSDKYSPAPAVDDLAAHFSRRNGAAFGS